MIAQDSLKASLAARRADAARRYAELLADGEKADAGETMRLMSVLGRARADLDADAELVRQVARFPHAKARLAEVCDELRGAKAALRALEADREAARRAWYEHWVKACEPADQVVRKLQAEHFVLNRELQELGGAPERWDRIARGE